MSYITRGSNKFSEISSYVDGIPYYRRFGMTEFGKAEKYDWRDIRSLHEIPEKLRKVCPDVPENPTPANPCDPFKVDVFSLGYIFKQDFLEVSCSKLMDCTHFD